MAATDFFSRVFIFFVFSFALLFGFSLAGDPYVSYEFSVSYITASPLGVPQQLSCLGSGVGEPNRGKTNTQAAFLESNRGRTVVVKLNSDLYYRGILAGVDGYMNISMVQAEEYVNGQLRQTHGVAVINGKGVLDISIVASEENQTRTESSNTQHQQPESSNTQHQQPESSNSQHQQPESSNTQGINKAIAAVVSASVMISTPEEITQVATISANGEREIGELIARAMEKVGKEGVITVADGNTLENELEVVEDTQHQQNTQQSESSNTQHQQPESSDTQHQQNTQQPESSDNRTNKEKMRDRRTEQANARMGTASKGFRKKDKHMYHDP